MSQAQLDNVQKERDALRTELQLLESSLDPKTACSKLIESFNGTEDPFNITTDNPYASSGSGGGCCTVS